MRNRLGVLLVGWRRGRPACGKKSPVAVFGAGTVGGFGGVHFRRRCAKTADVKEVVCWLFYPHEGRCVPTTIGAG